MTLEINNVYLNSLGGHKTIMNNHTKKLPLRKKSKTASLCPQGCPQDLKHSMSPTGASINNGFRKGQEHPKWMPIGTKRLSRGYILVKTSFLNKNGQCKWILEHHLVIEKKIGRKLTTIEQVHHINGIKNDNRPENLSIVNRYSHQVIHKVNYIKSESINEKISKHITAKEDTVFISQDYRGNPEDNRRHYNAKEFIKKTIDSYNESCPTSFSHELELSFEEYSRTRFYLNKFILNLYILQIINY